jgi:methyl-accepting chemotaxis protein
VRALSHRSADAAKQIKALIGTSTTKINQGVGLVAEAGKALDRIVGQVTTINDVVNEITASAQEESSSLAQVNTAVAELDGVTQGNAAMVEESTASSHSLAQETENLANLLGSFHVNGIDGKALTATDVKPVAAAKPERRKPALKPAAKPAAPPRKIAVNDKPTAAADGWEEF